MGIWTRDTGFKTDWARTFCSFNGWVWGVDNIYGI